MKKIGLVTLHAANNYGAVLQVYAMKKTLDKYGTCQLIDYRAEHVHRTLKPLRLSFEFRAILRVFKDILRLKERKLVIGKFWEFIYSEFNLSKRVYTKDDFKKTTQKFDVVVAGSDQIWNPNVVSTNGTIDDIYFLAGSLAKNNISYASSMGTYEYTGHDKEKLKSLLNDFNSIAVRESNTQKFIEHNCFLDAKHVLDPSLLIDKQDWLKVSKKYPEDFGDYILVYGLKKDKLLKDTISTIKKELKLKVVTIDQDPLLNYKPDFHLKDVGPYEFLDLFANAKFVITNSFHGCAFSLNLNKEFIVTTPPTGINRIESLLDIVQLKNRIIDDSYLATELLRDKIDILNVNHLLEKEREVSLQYLAQSMNMQ